MSRKLVLYILLMVTFLLKISLAGFNVWLPDFMLLLVIFSSVFEGIAFGLQIALVCGFLRGIFSPYMFPMDIVLFPLMGGMSFMLARMFYRQNPVVQMFITALGLFLVFTLQIIYMQALSGTALATDSVILNSWRMIILTIIAAPPVFFILNKLLVESE